MSEHEREELPEALSRLMTLDAGEGPAEAIDAAKSKAVVDAVLAEWTPTAAGAPAVGRRGRGLIWAAAALLFGAGSALAFYVARTPSTPAPVEPARVAAPHAPTVPETVQEPAPAEAPATVVAPLEAQDTQGEATSSTAAMKAVAPPRAAATDDLLLRANRLRGEGRYRAAAQTYMKVVKRAPQGAAAGVARVAAADLRLEQLGDPRGALALYSKVLSSPGALAIEAQAGVARAQRALGNREAEADALEALLRSQPRGPSADWARARLSALRGE